MANYYSIATADAGLKATREEYEALQEALEVDEDSDARHGFEIEYWDERTSAEVYIYAPEDEMHIYLSDRFLLLLGALIRKNGMPYLQFGVAFTADRPIMASHGGTYFRITEDGELIEPTLTWEV